MKRCLKAVFVLSIVIFLSSSGYAEQYGIFQIGDSLSDYSPLGYAVPVTKTEFLLVDNAKNPIGYIIGNKYVFTIEGYSWGKVNVVEYKAFKVAFGINLRVYWLIPYYRDMYADFCFAVFSKD